MAGKRNVLEWVRADDFVEYFLFPQINSADDREQEQQLNKLLKEVNKVLENYTKDYLWHKDEFKLIPRTSLSNSLICDNERTEYLPPHLYGVSHYGDNIEDEWFMVFLLKELTRNIEGLIARVHDVDGEFLLIEAANFLPNWANPDTCGKRVYMFEGNIHLIPPEDSDYEITVNEAISKIRDDPNETEASPEIQNAIDEKLENYPAKINDNIHRANAFLPVAVAAILKEKPNLIAPAVQAFCNRDPIDMKACRAMKFFPPENRVYANVKFTKCLYAMLKHSKYVPDRRTGWNLPPTGDPKNKPTLLGVKIACGFEILASQAKPSEDIESDKNWHAYLKSLKEKNYFQGQMEHSREYNNLLNKAKEYYINHRDSMYYTPSIGQEIVELTKNLEMNLDELKNEEKNLAPDDDESWLNITPEELDKLLQEKYGQKFTTFNNNSDPADFTKNITNFLDHVSDIDGVEFPSSPTRPPRGVKKRGNKVSFTQDTKADENKTNNRMSFDANQFSCAVQNILNFVIPEDDSWNNESDSDMSDYAEDNYVNVEGYEEVKSKMKKYMEEMDVELAGTTIGQSFEKPNENFEDIESFKPVDIDMNALKNILESYRSQLGEAGPSSNMLGPMGVHLDAKMQDSD